MTKLPTAREITDANRRFYDEIAPVYESVDSRRNEGQAHAWLAAVIDEIRAKLGGKTQSFLDAGAGSGFLVDRMRGKFSRRIAVDISDGMLTCLKDPGVEKIRAELEAIPLPDASIDCVGCFATLHHLYDPKLFFREAHRLLRPGGILYTDHDISMDFVNRFGAPLAFYRRLVDHGKNYLAACPRADARDYELSEFHGGRGLSGPELAAELRAIGFREVTLTHHWEGMGGAERLARFLPRALLARAGWSPIIRILASK